MLLFSGYVPAASLFTYPLLNAGRSGSSDISSNGSTPSAIAYVSTDAAAYFTIDGAILTGDFTLSFTVSPGNRWGAVGVFVGSETASFDSAAGSGRGGLNAMTNSFYFMLQSAGVLGTYKGNTLQTSLIHSGSTAFQLVRVGSTITFKQNGLTITTLTSQTTADVYVAFAHANGGSSPADDITAASVLAA